MENNENTEFSAATEALYDGTWHGGADLYPETLPVFMTTAFTMKGFQEVQDTYARKGYTYIRTRNPNRTALGQIISRLECGEETLIMESGMGAITSTLMTVLNPGDHVICNANIYGETFEVFTTILNKMNITCSFVDYQDIDNIKNALQPNTKLIYSEVLSNPTLRLVDLKAVADIAHTHGAFFMVDNTFTTPIAIQPMKFGADIVINSLTKFLNGHSDVMGGSVTTTHELCDQIQPLAMLLGTPGDAYSSWLIQRGIVTANVRLPHQMKVAEKLAHALSKNPHVSVVNHPSLPDYPQRDLADKMFGEKGSCAMLSFIVPEDMEKLDQFMMKLKFPRYAPTLGGFRTTLSHPVTSSHPHVPDDIRRKMGITPGMIRVSCGLEDPDDLIRDFEEALTVFD